MLGKNPEISVVEIISYLNNEPYKYQIKERSQKYLWIQADKLDTTKIMKALGGTTKIAQETTIDKIIIHKNKITYGVNFLTKDDKVKEELKKIFKTERIKALYKRPKQELYTPKESNNLDIELICLNNKRYQVCAVSNPREYKKRDETRPNFDAKSVISIRLAKILINLAKLKQNQTLLDPMCGLGTILQEVALQNMKGVGLEKDKETAKKASQNLKNYNKVQVIHADATKLSQVVSFADAVVTEPDLGAYFKSYPELEIALKTKQQLEITYEKMLQELKKVTKGLIVMIVPEFKTKKGIVKINMNKILSKVGLQIHQEVKDIPIPLDYNLKRSVILRKIYILSQ